MKNQYVGDIGDYGKYSLLRAFINAGVKIGVNWYLTENDDSNDGKFTDYLNKKDEYRRYDQELFDVIKRIAPKKNKSVMDIQNSGILPGTIFYSDMLNPVGTPSDRRNTRERWLEESIHALEDADLIFMDPDNGLLEDNNTSKLGDGQLAVKSSNDPNCTHVISADLFCRSIGLW